MFNFCLIVILLSALRNILYQIDADTIKAVDDKLETMFFTIVGVFIFLSEVVKPSKTEIALYQKQKELALNNARDICSKIKSTLVALYGRYISTHASTQQKTEKQQLRLLPVSNENELFNESNSDVA